MQLAIKRIVFFAALFGLMGILRSVYLIFLRLCCRHQQMSCLAYRKVLVDGSLFQDLGASFTRLLIGLYRACYWSITWDIACEGKNSR